MTRSQSQPEGSYQSQAWKLPFLSPLAMPYNELETYSEEGCVCVRIHVTLLFKENPMNSHVSPRTTETVEGGRYLRADPLHQSQSREVVAVPPVNMDPNNRATDSSWTVHHRFRDLGVQGTNDSWETVLLRKVRTNDVLRVNQGCDGGVVDQMVSDPGVWAFHFFSISLLIPSIIFWMTTCWASPTLSSKASER